MCAMVFLQKLGDQLVGNSSLLPPHGSWGLNSSYQAWHKHLYPVTHLTSPSVLVMINDTLHLSRVQIEFLFAYEKYGCIHLLNIERG